MANKSDLLKNETFINLSEQLREELVRKVEEVFESNSMGDQIFDINIDCLTEAEEDILIHYLTAFKDYDNESANKIIRAIRIWCNMYYDDRLSVLEKFKDCYQNDSFINLVSKTNSCFVFCRLFINDLSMLLNNVKWSAIEKFD